METQKQK